MISIAKEYTNKSNETEAIQAFKEVLNSSSMWHNNGSFPKNESDENAFKKCTSPETAAQYCPVRWKAVNKYVKTMEPHQSSHKRGHKTCRRINRVAVLTGFFE